MLSEYNVKVGVIVEFDEDIHYCDSCSTVITHEPKTMMQPYYDYNVEPCKFEISRILADDKCVVGVDIKPLRKVFLREYLDAPMKSMTLSLREFMETANLAFLDNDYKKEEPLRRINEESAERMVKKKVQGKSWLIDLCGIAKQEVCRHLSYNIGVAVELILRKDDSSKEKRIEDLWKAIFHIEDEIKRIEDQKKD